MSRKMKKTKGIIIFILLDIFFFFLGDIISPIRKLVEKFHTQRTENTILANSNLQNELTNDEENLYCRFLSSEDFIALLISEGYAYSEAVDFVDYIEKRAQKANFLKPEIKNYLVNNNFKFALPNDINNNWMGKIYINNNGRITSFPPIIFQKGFIFGEGVSSYTKATYSYISRRELIDYCVYSGMPSSKAIEFEQNLYKAKPDSQLVFEDSTLPDEVKNTMINMNYDYSVLTSNTGIWSGLINIKHGEKVYTFGSSNITSLTDYFNIKNNVPIYLEEYDCTYNYLLYDDNWEIFRLVFFGPDNPLSIRKRIFYPVENSDYELNTVLSTNVKNTMINGKYSFSELYDPDTGSWLGVRNMLRNNNFYIYRIQ